MRGRVRDPQTEPNSEPRPEREPEPSFCQSPCWSSSWVQVRDAGGGASLAMVRGVPPSSICGPYRPRRSPWSPELGKTPQVADNAVWDCWQGVGKAGAGYPRAPVKHEVRQIPRQRAYDVPASGSHRLPRAATTAILRKPPVAAAALNIQGLATDRWLRRDRSRITGVRPDDNSSWSCAAAASPC